MLGYPGLYFYDGERMHFQGNPAMEENQEKQKEQKHPDGCFTCDEYKMGLEAGRAQEEAEKFFDNAQSYHDGFIAGQKQKENSKSYDSIPSDCVSDAKCEDRWHKVGDSLPDNPREVLCKDEAGNYFIGRYYVSEGWEISNYDDEDKPHHLNPPVSKWIDLPSEKQKEQKPGEDSEYRKAYLDGWNARNLQAAREQKPAWSEEDETNFDYICDIIDAARDNGITDTKTAWDLRSWLKSLRPQEEEERNDL